MIPTPRLLESLARVTPLAVRFWDEVTHSTISNGLKVVAYASDQPDRQLPPIENRHHTFVWYDLPGLRVQEFGKGDKAYWDSPLSKRTFTIEVQDDGARFLPFSFEVTAPSLGVIKWQCATASGPFSNPPDTVPLHCAPTRVMPAALATIRLEVQRDQFDTQLKAYPPAAWAMIEAYDGATLIARTLADEKGRALLVFPYPALQSGDLEHSFLKHEWTIDLRAYHDRAMSDSSPPNLCIALSQKVTKLWSSVSPKTEFNQVTLTFGQPAVIVGSPAGKRPDTLLVWVTPV